MPRRIPIRRSPEKAGPRQRPDTRRTAEAAYKDGLGSRLRFQPTYRVELLGALNKALNYEGLYIQGVLTFPSTHENIFPGGAHLYNEKGKQEENPNRRYILDEFDARQLFNLNLQL